MKFRMFIFLKNTDTNKLRYKKVHFLKNKIMIKKKFSLLISARSYIF